MKIFIGAIVLLSVISYYVFLWRHRRLVFYFDDQEGPAENFINLFMSFFVWLVLMGGVNFLGVSAWLYLWGLTYLDLHIFPFFSYLAGSIAVIVTILNLICIKHFYFLTTKHHLEVN